MKTPSVLLVPFVALVVGIATLCAAPKNTPDAPAAATLVSANAMPHRVHVFEDYETDIERRWWLRGKAVTDNVPPSLSKLVPNRRVCRATETADFDDKMGDRTKKYKAVIFNPVPGPPMGKNTRLAFRYWLWGTDSLRVQIYSLTNNYHRRLELTGLPREKWESAVVDMTQARRPDGSGGPLGENERIDDIQFYIDPAGELLIDDIVLFDAAEKGERRPMPRRVAFTGWFDTGKQGQEWPGDFEIVPHEKPLAWKAARSIVDPQTGQSTLRVHLRGRRPLGDTVDLRFRYRLSGADAIDVRLSDSKSDGKSDRKPNDKPADALRTAARDLVRDRWSETTVRFTADKPTDRQAKTEPAPIVPSSPTRFADDLVFQIPKGATLLVDDVLLFEPDDAK